VQAPICVTENVRFLMFIAPLRVPPELPATEYATDAFPLDVDTDVTVSQLALLTAFQGQPVAAVTATLPDAAALLRLALGGAIPSTEHEDWVTATAIPPMVIAAERGAASKLGETEILTEPFPLPLDPAAMLAQVLSVLAVQAHPCAAETEMLYVPPIGPADTINGLGVTAHD
jgi:hypothetical protein